MEEAPAHRLLGGVMTLHKRLGRILLVALGVALAAKAGGASEKKPKAAAPKTAAATTPEPALEPKAIDVVKAMSARLAAAHTMTFDAVSTYESPSLLGPPLVYTTISHVTLQRPEKLVVITPGDGPASEFYYDGKTMMAYAPAENLVAVADAPPTIDAMLKAAYDSAAIYFPFADVIVADPYADLSNGLRTAFYIGQSRVVGGTTTDMVAIAGNGVFAQLWIGAEDKLPRMARAVYAADPSALRHEVVISDWHIDGQVAADAFTSSRAAAAPHIKFARPDPQPPSGAAPGSKTKSSNPKK
jgi:hypothetical protein